MLFNHKPQSLTPFGRFHALGAYSCEYIANLLEQRQRLLPTPGALHLTHGGEALALELPPPDLSLYDQS